jgi:hypothetical protein
LIAHGGQEQRRRYLPNPQLRRGRCQLFSGPTPARIWPRHTRAVAGGDSFRVDGRRCGRATRNTAPGESSSRA